MINPKYIKTASAVVSLVKPFVLAVIGGVVVSMMNRCQEQKPVTLVVTNQQYEKQISNIKAQQDSVAAVLPDLVESLRYLSEKYK